jgi:hypothetical protein
VCKRRDIVPAAATLLLSGCLVDIQGEMDRPAGDTAVQPDVRDTAADVAPETAADVAPEDSPADPDADPALDVPDAMDVTGEDVEPEMPVCDGPMTVYYIDRDGDGYGDVGSGVEWCAPPPGYADNHDDCMDDHPEVHPNQDQWYATDRGDGSFDYDCDGVETEFYTSTTECNDWNCDGEGWHGTSVPECGATATWRHCVWEWLWCVVDDTDVVQLCR